MSFVFEKAFNVSFTPMAGNDPIDVDSLVKARLYSTLPSQQQKEDHTNADPGDAVAVNSADWSTGPNSYEKTIPFDAINDPEPHNGNKWEEYFLVVSYKQESGGDTVFALRKIYIYKPGAITSRFGATLDQVYQLQSKLENFEATINMPAKLRFAEHRVLRKLASMGKERRLIVEQDALDAVLYLTAHLGCLDLVNRERGDWKDKAEEMKEAYEEIVNFEPIRVDSDDDGGASPKDKQRMFSGIAVR